MADLSILIPARNEEYLARTIEDILEHIQGDTEIIAVCDGNWPDPPVKDHPRVTLVYHSKAIGQRAATNEAARLSQARFIMKCDAHCAFASGFDVELMANCEPDWTVIPRMYNLHVFDWQCQGCGKRTYMGPYPDKCDKCNGIDFEKVMVWQRRKRRRTDFAMFDNNLKFQYWRAYGKRPEAQGDIADVMCSVGACWMMHQDRFWQLGSLDESHGSWGQMGVEVACKSWLSGGRQVVNKKTWFAHMFRTQPGFNFPYPNPGVEQARQYSRDMWLGDKWEGAVRPLSWLLEKFYPIPTWHETKGIVYYTDNRLDSSIFEAVQKQIRLACPDCEIIVVSLEPVTGFGDKNIVLDEKRGILTMFRQILAGLEVSAADIIFFCEHDILYHPSHFDFVPGRDDEFYYNENTWKVDAKTGQALFYYTKQTSGLCAFRTLLLEHYRKRVAQVEEEGKYSYKIGFEPGCHAYPRGIDEFRAKEWMSEQPNIDIRHQHNLTKSRWDQSEFRNKKYCQGWTMSDEVPGWGIVKGRFDEFLQEVSNGSLPL